MSIKIKNVPGEPIILVTIIDPIKVPDDVLAALQASADFKRSQGKPIYRIIDFTQLAEDVSFSSLVNAMSIELNVEGGINDPDVSTIYVGSTEWVLFGAAAFKNQVQYGKTNVIHICGTENEGIEFARKDLQSKKK